jgi:hypothetical protein
MKVRLPHYGTNKCETDRTMPTSKPDIIIHDNKQGTCMLIDAAIPGDRSVTKKAEKILKYKNLIIEIQHMWNVRAKVKPVNETTFKNHSVDA